MYVITGITGQVGGGLAHQLLSAGLPVRAVVRNPAKGAEWAARACEVALADMADPAALTSAFTGATAVFVMLPPNFDPAPGFPEAQRMIAALQTALAAARPERVVVLSTIGAQASQPNLLNQLGMLETAMATLALPVTLLRAAWFIENSRWDVATARELGHMPSFLQPLDRPVPMVSCADIAIVAAELMQQHWQASPSAQPSPPPQPWPNPRIVELEGPQRIAPRDIAAGLARLLQREVSVEAVPRDDWEAVFTAQGMQHPLPRMQMLDGFNQGWIRFEAAPADTRKGVIPLDQALRGLTD